MKITIDTKEDSPEEIRKIIRMLYSLVGEKALTNQGNMFRNQGSEVSNDDIFGMFDDPNQSTPEQQTDEKEETEEVRIDIPEVEEYH